MKEQILQIERMDDLHSLRDKINRAQSGRLLLVWPVLDKPVRRRLDFMLLRTWAHRIGTDLVLISADPRLRLLAASTGLQVYPTLAAAGIAQLHPMPTPAPSHPRAKRMMLPRPPREKTIALHPAARIALFLTALLALPAVWILCMPAARVRATFPSRRLESSILLDNARTLPLSVEVQASGRLSTSGSRRVPTAFATGNALFKNIGAQMLYLPAGIRVMTDSGVVFETADGMALPVGAARSLPIRAVAAGTAGNVAAGKIRTVTGSLALALSVQNPTPTSGGAERVRRIIADADLAALRAELESGIRDRAAKELASAAGRDALLAEDAIQVRFSSDDLPDNPAGSAADTVGLTLHATLHGMAYPLDTAGNLARAALHSALASGEQLSEESISLALHWTAGSGLRLDSTGLALRSPSREQLASALRGRPVGSLPAFLAEAYGASGAATSDPAWFPLMPFFSFRIQVELSPAVEAS